MDDGDRVGTELRRRAAVLAGDEAAWREWYDATYDGLRAYVHWRCGGLAQLVDEVLQDTWLTAVRRVRAFDPRRGSFQSWLTGIAANFVRNRLRMLSAERRRVAGGAVAHRAAPEGPVGDEVAERAIRVSRALAELDPRYEQVLRAKYLEQMSVRMIADAWRETPKAIESLLTRARQAFREAYEAVRGDDG
jgi:RNA polymerase sigma-70 factor (ECF subfamily)